MRVAVFNGKGGVGKSTIAANLAVLTHAVLLDADPQATCCYWCDRRESNTPEVLDVSLGRVAIRLRKLESAVIDLPGASVPGLQETLSAADIIVIPISYDQASLDALPATLELVRGVNKTLGLVINRLHPRTNIDSIVTSLLPLNIPVCTIPIRERVNHRDWWASGKVAADYLNSDAGQEIQGVWTWLEEIYHG